MWGAPRRGRDFAPAVHEHPANEAPRARVVAPVAEQSAKEEDDVLLKRIELVEKRFARSEEVSFQLAVDLQDKGRFRLVVRVISGEEVGKKLAIFVDRIDRRTEKPRLAAEPAPG